MSTHVNFSAFSAEQLKFMIALADPDDHRSQKELAIEFGLREETLSRWKRMPGFGEVLWKLTYANLEGSIGRVSEVLLRNALNGDARSQSQ